MGLEIVKLGLHSKCESDIICRIHERAFGENSSTSPEYPISLLSDPHAIVLGAYLDGEMVAYRAAEPLKRFKYIEPINKMRSSLDDSLYLAIMACLPEHQGKGIGTQLMRTCLQKAVEAGYVKAGGHFIEGRAQTIARHNLKIMINRKLGDFAGDGKNYSFVYGRI